MTSNAETLPSGLVAGGMLDGTVAVWDPARIASKHPSPNLSTVSRHSGPVPGLQFNPHPTSSHLLASGGSDAGVHIISMARPDAPDVFVPAPPPCSAKHAAEVSTVAWNTQVRIFWNRMYLFLFSHTHTFLLNFLGCSYCCIWRCCRLLHSVGSPTEEALVRAS